MLKNFKTTLLLILLIIPILCFAHGEEILIALFIQVLSIIVFIIVLFTINLNLKGKGILSIIYILTTGLFLSIINKIPYRQNMQLINWLIFIVPVIIITLSYMYLKPRFKKQKSFPAN